MGLANTDAFIFCPSVHCICRQRRYATTI